MTLETYERGVTVTVAGHAGIAWEVLGPETQPDADTEWSGIEEPTGLFEVCMVGDDRTWVFDPEDFTVITSEDYCGGCGQTNCYADGRETTR